MNGRHWLHSLASATGHGIVHGVCRQYFSISLFDWRMETMKLKKIFATGALLAMAAGAAHAQATDPQAADTKAADVQTADAANWYVAPIVSLTINSPHRADRIGAAGGFALGRKLNDNFNVELSGQYVAFGSHDNQASIDVDGLYFFTRTPMFSPYVVAGVGAVYEGPLPVHGRNSNVLVRGGAGFTTNLAKNIDLRVDARYQWHSSGSGKPGLGDVIISTGLNFYF